MMSKIVNLTTLFIDIVDSIELANYWNLKKYNDFLNEFQKVMLNMINLWKKRIKKISINGDELVIFYDSEDVSSDIEEAISIANTLKIAWYTSKTNLERIKEGKKILDLGIGINTGKAIFEKRSDIKTLKNLIKNRKTYEGFSISLAKRIETFSRQGKYSKIMIGHNTMVGLNKLFHNYEFEYTGLQNLRGLSQEIPVFELKSCYSETAPVIAKFSNLKFILKQLEQILIYDPSNIWLYMTLIDIYNEKKNFKKVEQLCKESINIDNTIANIHYELANALSEQKKYDEALNYAENSIRLRPNLWYLYFLKTTVLIYLGRYDECIKICNHVIKSAPKWYINFQGHFIFYNMAASYARKGEKIKALSNLKKAVVIGGNEVLSVLKKDEDEDFINLYTNDAFNKILHSKVVDLQKKSKL